MKKIAYILCTFMLLLLLASGGAAFGQYIPNAPFKPQYPKAPDFTLKDTEGKIFKMSAVRGKPVLIFFGTTWCPGCRAETPTYKKVYETYSPRGLEVIYINIMEPAAKVKRFVKSAGLPYRALLDEDGTVGQQYGAVGVPTIVLVNKEGRVVKIGHSSSEMPLEQVLQDQEKPQGRPGDRGKAK